MADKESVYQELNAIYGKAIPTRIAFLYNKMKLFLQAYGVAEFTLVNENILCRLVIDYFADIVRLKRFHNIKFTNKEKIVAYTAYWICRRKPIQFKLARIDDKHLFINEAFVATYIADEIADMSKKSSISEQLKHHLFYHLKYRLLDAQSFELAIKSYTEAMHGK